MKRTGQENTETERTTSVSHPRALADAAAAPGGAVGPHAVPPPLPPEAMTTAHLLKEAASDVAALAKKELALAKAELRADVGAELTMLTGMGFAALTGVLVVNALVVAAIFGLARVMPGWGAALVVSGVLAVVAGIVVTVSWRKRVRSPLARTRRSLEAEARQLKELRT
jgi:hypothetical protein